PKEAPCFMIFVQERTGKKFSKALSGPVAPSEYEGMQGSTTPNHGMPRFAAASFDAAYPFAVVHLEDPHMPVSVQARIFNPFIPGDAESSGIPIAIIRYKIKNKTAHPLTIAVAGA